MKMSMHHTRLAGLVVALCSAAAWCAPPSSLVKATLLADTKAVQPGQPFRVGLLLKIAPKWHLYWQNPGDGGIPTTVELKLPDGFTASPVQYPVPQRFDQEGGLVSYGYEDEVMLLATITPPAAFDAPNVTIHADANWLVCQESCVAGDAKLSVTLPVGEPGPSEQEIFERWIARLPMAMSGSGIRTVAQTTAPLADENQGTLTIKVVWGHVPPAELQWFPPASESVIFDKPRLENSDKTITITTKFTRLAGKPPPQGLESVLAYKKSTGVVGITIPVDLNRGAASAN
jgi:thiol:disulfide interchange protein DsbD